MCKVLKVSRSGYYKWRNNLKPLSRESIGIDKDIACSFEKSRGSYGSPRVYLDLIKQGYQCSEATVARRMQHLGLAARKKKQFRITTQSNHDYPIAPNLLNRQFEVAQTGKAWVSDITYIRVGYHWLYLTVIIDLADRMVVGWSLSTKMTTKDTVIAAFKKACIFRSPSDGFIFHSDRGVQYASTAFKQLLSKANGIQSMSRKGNCWDNAVAESFFKTIKVECIYQKKITNNQQAYSIIFDYIDGWYNTIRIHSTLNGLSPLETYKLITKKLLAA